MGLGRIPVTLGQLTGSRGEWARDPHPNIAWVTLNPRATCHSTTHLKVLSQATSNIGDSRSFSPDKPKSQDLISSFLDSGFQPGTRCPERPAWGAQARPSPRIFPPALLTHWGSLALRALSQLHLHPLQAVPLGPGRHPEERPCRQRAVGPWGRERWVLGLLSRV